MLIQFFVRQRLWPRVPAWYQAVVYQSTLMVLYQSVVHMCNLHQSVEHMCNLYQSVVRLKLTFGAQTNQPTNHSTTGIS